jgi:hypothetical protein
MTDRQSEEWEAEEVEPSRSVGVVISVRVSADLATQLSLRAQQRGVKTSTLLREAIEGYLSNESAAPSLEFTVTSHDAPVSLYAGRSQSGRTGTTARITVNQS